METNRIVVQELTSKGGRIAEHDYFCMRLKSLMSGTMLFSAPHQQADLCSVGVMLSEHMAIQLVSGWDRGRWDCRGS